MSDKILQDYKFIAEAYSRDQPPVFKVLHNGVESVVPATLVKYYSLNQFSVDAITKHQFYVAHPEHLNDPYDCSRYLIDYESVPLKPMADFLDQYGYSYEYLKSIYVKDKAKVVTTFREHLWTQHFAYLGILSLCESINNYHLWSYYTAHTGFNIEISTRLPTEFLGPFKIIYLPENQKQDRPTIQRYNAVTEFKDPLELLLGNVLIKSSFWRDEAEWRYLVFSQKAMEIPPSQIEIDHEDPIKRLIDYHPDVVTSITLAVRFFMVSEYHPDLTKPMLATLIMNNPQYVERSYLRKRLLDHIIEHQIPTCMMFEESRDDKLVLCRRSVEITPANGEGYMINIFNEL